jgi:hypothetical protein
LEALARLMQDYPCLVAVDAALGSLAFLNLA